VLTQLTQIRASTTCSISENLSVPVQQIDYSNSQSQSF
jgi:hypothetical protein